MEKLSEFLPSILSGCILLLVVFAAMIGFEPSYNLVCAKERGANCLRDWLSALGGWATLVAAIPTLYYLNRQVRAAIQANQNSARIALRKNRSLARKTLYECSSLSQFAGAITYIWDGNAGRTPSAPRSMAVEHLENMNKIVEKGIFKAFEDEIDIPDEGSIEKIKSYIASFLKDFRGSDEELTLDQYQIAEESMKILGRMAADYADSCVSAAKAFLIEADGMMGAAQSNTAV